MQATAHGSIGAALAATCAFACFVGVSALALAQDDSGLSPTRLKLPSGPGSLEGVGENAEANFNMGLVTYAVPFSLPAGYQGFSPSLGLSYASAGGEGVAGIGWDIGAPTIERTTVRGLPEYDGNDVFATSGGAELVRIPGTRTYRERFEGSFVRYTWLAVGNGREGYWKAEYPDGRVGYFGARADGSLVPEARMAGYGGTFAYYLVEMVDVFDHRIVYDYVLDGGRPYLSHIGWVASQGAWRYEAELTYEPRQDVLSDGKPGIEVFLAQRLTDVRVLVRGQQLRRYHLAYEPYAETGGLTRLASVSTYGTLDDAPYPIIFSFEYTQGFDPTCSSPAECVPPFVETVGSVGANFATGNVELIDMNGDALPDVIDTRDGIHRIYEQRLDENGEATFAAVRTSSVAGTGAMALSAPEVQLLDLNGDGFTDMVDGLNDRVLWGSGTGEWKSQDLLTTNLPAFADDANLRTLDVDYDRQMDVVHFDAIGSWYVRNQGYGVYATTEALVDGVGRSFSQDGLQLADMNGDGMVDLVQPVIGAVFYWANLGWGRFGATTEMFGIPETLTPPEMLFTDLNGDGLTDVVVVQGTEVRYSLNQNGEAFAPMATITSANVDGDLPERTGEVSIRFADMNGSGSEDVVWITASGQVTYLELFPMRPNLLRKVTNGIGKVIEMEYGSTVTHMARDGGPSAWSHRLPHPMQVLERLITYDTLSMVQQIQEMHYRDGYFDGQEHQFRGFAEVEVFAYGDASIEDGRTVHRFDVGAEDRYRKGLALGQDVESAGRVLSSVERAYDDCDVASVPETVSPAVRFVCPTAQITTVKEGLGPEAWVTIEENYGYDGYGNRTETHKLGVTSVGGGACVSCEGRPVEVQGEPCDATCRGDEMHERIDFVAPVYATAGRWILGAHYRKRTWGVDGSDQVTDERTYYDGPDFTGMAWGRLERGVVRRTEARRDAGGDYFVQTGRFRHDEHGNVVEVMDPNGHRRTLAYEEDALLLTSETAHFDDRAEPYALRMDVQYDPLVEQIVRSTPWLSADGSSLDSTSRRTLYEYDQYARLIAIAEPGDDVSTPTQEFEYLLASPASRIVMRSRTASGGTTDLEYVQCFDGLGRKFQERTRIEPGKYQVSGFSLFHSQGGERHGYQPYVGSAVACDAVPPADVRYTETASDAIGRPLLGVDPDASLYGTPSITRMAYVPLAVITYDGEDNDPSSAHYGTPSTSRTDGLGRIVGLLRLSTVDGDPVKSEVRYDALGRIRALVDNEGNEHWQRYDLLGRIIYVNHPDSGATQMEHDDASNLARRVDARGKEMRLAYDEANRRTRMWDADDPEGTEVAWSYDGTGGCDSAVCTHPEGQLTEVNYPILDARRGLERFGFDVRGRGVRRQYARGQAVYDFVEVYDNADRQIATIYPSGLVLTKTLDGLGRAVAVPSYVEAIEYTEHNQAAGLALHNGAVTKHEYDDVLRMRSLETALPGGNAFLDYGYQYNREGHVTRVVDYRVLDEYAPSETADYAYDSLYRLIEAHLDPGRPAAGEEVLSYAYDTIDNMVRKTSSLGEEGILNLGEMRYGEDAAGPHALTTLGVGTPSAERWHYDDAGNVIDQAGMRHEWDFAGRMTKSAFWNGDEAKYAYGPGHQRTQKREGDTRVDYLAPDFEVRNGIATVYVVLGERRIVRIEESALAASVLPDMATDGKIDVADAWLANSVPAGIVDVEVDTDIMARLDATSVGELLGAAAHRILLGDDGVATTYLHGNHQGTIVAETDETGSVLSRSIAYPFGFPRQDSHGVPTHWHTGQERDRGTGLSYHSARYLEMRVGRWMSADPGFHEITEESIENMIEAMAPYTYARSAPLDYIDPLGTDAVVLHGGGPGNRGGVAGLGVAVRKLFDPYQWRTIPEYRPDIDYNNVGISWNNGPTPGIELAHAHHHRAGTPRILAGFSMGGDAALHTRGPAGGGKWDLRVIAGARVGNNFVSALERAARTSDRVIVAAIRGDAYMANDGAASVFGGAFGDRSYEAVVRAIEADYGSLERFYESHRNVVIEEIQFRPHGGGGNSWEMQRAVQRGYRALDIRDAERRDGGTRDPRLDNAG